MPCPDATYRAGFRSRFEPLMGTPDWTARNWVSPVCAGN